MADRWWRKLVDKRRTRASSRRSDAIYMASASGGHIDLLAQLGFALRGIEKVWVTQESQRARQLEREGQSLHWLPVWDRNFLRGRFAANIRQSWRIASRERPNLVVTTGSGLVVPFCVFARLYGAR